MNSQAAAGDDDLDQWRSVDVESWSPDEDEEPLGSKEKFWVRDASRVRWLFKFARTSDDGFVSGEDWAEVPPPLNRVGPDDMDGFDIWAGSLFLDAWVAGSDRHDENWGAVTDGSVVRLAPSFDHGNALGSQVPALKPTRR